MIPRTPADGLNVSSEFRLAMESVFQLASVSKFWEKPYSDAASSYEEMELLDKFYWLYKCNNPVAKPQDDADKIVTITEQTVQLPEDFIAGSSVTMSAAGDLFYEDCLKNSGDILYEDVADLLFDQDIRYANFESPILATARPAPPINDQESPLQFCTLSQFDILKGHKGRNWNVLHTANNHIADAGADGLIFTQDVLAQNNILDVGTNTHPSDYGRAKLVRKNGLTIAFVSATYSLNGRELLPDDAFRVNYSKLCSKYAEPDTRLLKQQIDWAKQHEADFIIASLHWGYEFEFFPRQNQVTTAHELIEYGADAIIGHHPHVLQPVEYYQTKRDPSRIAVIAYSLGSLAWTFSAPHLTKSGILNLKLTAGTERGVKKTIIENADITPVVRQYMDDNATEITKISRDPS